MLSESRESPAKTFYRSGAGERRQPDKATGADSWNAQQSAGEKYELVGVQPESERLSAAAAAPAAQPLGDEFYESGIRQEFSFLFWRARGAFWETFNEPCKEP